MQRAPIVDLWEVVERHRLADELEVIVRCSQDHPEVSLRELLVALGNVTEVYRLVAIGLVVWRPLEPW
jgi:hypothetical protein